MTQTTVDFGFADLAASVAEAAPRVLVLAAPPGYGKSAFLRAYAARTGRRLTPCELGAGGAADLFRPVLDALVAPHQARATRSAADRLAQRRPAATSRETLRREWPFVAGPELFVLHDPLLALATPPGVDLLAELIRTLPAQRSLAISTRSALPPALQHAIAREPARTIAHGELALRFEQVQELTRRAGAPAAARAIYDRTAGWPLVCRLLAGLLRHHSAAELLDAAAALAPAALLPFAAHRTVAALAGPVREALVVAALLRTAGYPDLVRVLGEDCDDAVFARLVALPFVELERDRVTVHPEVTALLRTRFEPLVRALYERILHVLAGDGAYVRAARLALDAGDAARAAAMIDAAPPYTAAPVPLGEYERVIDRIDRGLITQYPNLWIATIPYRSLSVDPLAYVREAETVYFCLPAASGADQRAAALMLLASAYANVGRPAESEQLIEDALHDFAAERSPARAAILNFAASLRGIEGRFALARALAREAAAVSRDAFGENQTLHYIDAHEAAYRGRQDRVVVILDELLRRRSREELPLYLAYVATNGMLISWVNGDDAAFERYLTALEDAITPGLEAGFAPLIDGARGRLVQSDEDHPWPVVTAMAQLYRLGAADTRESALDAARAAARAADRRRDPYTQILAHAAVHVLDRAARPHEAAVLSAIVAPFESAEMRAAVEGIVNGGSAGILEPFVRRRVLREREPEREQPGLRVELLTGSVRRAGAPVRLTDKEFELIALLAATRGSLSRDRIGEALWDHLDSQEWANNFKVTLYRVRKKLARDVVLADEGGYRLSPAVAVDLRGTEARVRERVAAPLDGTVREELRALLAAFRGGAAARYERFAWAHALLARIHDLVCAAGTALAADALAGDRPADALAFARELREIDPFDERACELAVRALLAQGDADGARREYQRYTAGLAHELGMVPSRHLAELVISRP